MPLLGAADEIATLMALRASGESRREELLAYRGKSPREESCLPADPSDDRCVKAHPEHASVIWCVSEVVVGTVGGPNPEALALG